MLNTIGPVAFFMLVLLVLMWITAKTLIHAQKRPADNGDSDWLVDALT